MDVTNKTEGKVESDKSLVHYDDRLRQTVAHKVVTGEATQALRRVGTPRLSYGSLVPLPPLPPPWPPADVPAAAVAAR